jgi:hypothetical protein
MKVLRVISIVASVFFVSCLEGANRLAVLGPEQFQSRSLAVPSPYGMDRVFSDDRLSPLSSDAVVGSASEGSAEYVDASLCRVGASFWNDQRPLMSPPMAPPSTPVIQGENDAATIGAWMDGLCAAAAHHDGLQRLVTLFAHNPDVEVNDIVDKYGMPLIFYAVRNAVLDNVVWLVLLGADLEATDHEGRNLVTYCPDTEQGRYIKNLITSIVDFVNAGSAGCYLSAMYALFKEDYDRVNHLVAALFTDDDDFSEPCEL